MSRSSVEAGYRTLACTTSELIWLKGLLSQLEVQVKSTMIFCDNQAVIHLTSNPFFHDRSKHIEIDCHFLREHVNSGFLKLVHVRTQHQLPDLLTKPVIAALFQ